VWDPSPAAWRVAAAGCEPWKMGLGHVMGGFSKLGCSDEAIRAEREGASHPTQADARHRGIPPQKSPPGATLRFPRIAV